MPLENWSHPWVFREGRSRASGETARSGLIASLQKCRRPGRDALVDALLRAGELETALADCGSEDAGAAAALTNAVAAALLGIWTGGIACDSLLLIAEQLRIPQEIQLSTPEGFAYYSLHPLTFSELIGRLEITAPRVAVIGIRSIGATLSAVVAAALARRNVRAERTSVRPEGHPFDRHTRFSPGQLRWIAAHRAGDADFFVVDEGPGLSGSSFLSVGDALLEAGVERRHIRFLCSREPDADALKAVRAAERWRAYDVRAVGSNIPGLPSDARIDGGAGQWRHWLYASEGEWPASWIYMERTKFLSEDRARLFKFAGYGRFGATFTQRARTLNAGGFGPEFFGAEEGYAAFRFLPGRPARPQDLTRAVVERIADYCALRAYEFSMGPTDGADLTAMVRWNYENQYGAKAPAWLQLETGGPATLCDARMQPHEWLLDGGLAIKTDGEMHGDDHFFPGPCDIAWDLAGAIVEWQMGEDAAESLLRRYTALTGDNPRSRMPAYIAGYAVFRAAYCAAGAYSLQGTDDGRRLSQAAARYFVIACPAAHPCTGKASPEERVMTGRGHEEEHRERQHEIDA